MPLIAEDGSCIEGSNAFVTREELIAFAELYYPATTVPDSTATDGAIVRASLWLSTYPLWNGSRACNCRGLLAWPRSGVVDCDGCEIADNVIPEFVKQATYIAALAELASPGALTPTITPGKQVKREKVSVIEVEYMTPSDQGAYDGKADPLVVLRPVLTQVRDLLRCVATFPGANNTSWPWVA